MCSHISRSTYHQSEEINSSNSSTPSLAEFEEEEVIVIGTSLRTNQHYYQIYMIYMNLMLNGLIPLLTLVVLNSLVYHRLRWRLC